MKTICIYHNRDLDGQMAAAIVKKYFIEKNKDYHIKPYGGLNVTGNVPELTMLGWGYGDGIPDLSEYDKVIMCDVSFPPEKMLEIYNIQKEHGDGFIWIDHHSSAINNSLLPDSSNSILMTNFATCELTWKYFFPEKKMPEIVRLLGRYACYGYKGTEEEQLVLTFQYAAKEGISDYSDAYSMLCADIDHDITEDMLLRGMIIYNYLHAEAEHIYKKAFFITLIESNKVNSKHTRENARIFLCVNQERFNPIDFGIDYHKDGYEGFACFWYDKGKWLFVLYSESNNIDCLDIAKQYKGSGNSKTAEFTVKNLNQIIK